MKVSQIFGMMVVTFLVLLSAVSAAPGGVDLSDPCVNATVSYSGDLSLVTISNSCTDVSISWDDWLNMTILGNIVDGDVFIGDTWVEVDSVLRPDLDESATITFFNPPFAVEPNILKDSTTCSSPECNLTVTTGRMVLEVGGFSNYSLHAKQEFTVYSDPKPELKEKVYQTVDLGDAHRGTTFMCIVQIYGVNEDGEYILVQTNPKRSIQARLFGSPDQNLPESLGYFPTTSGMANVYFDGGVLSGYNDFEYVVQCSSNSTKLVYEEPISTRYSPVGRDVVGRGVWLADGSNAFYIVIIVVLAVLALLLLMKFGRTLGWWR